MPGDRIDEGLDEGVVTRRTRARVAGLVAKRRSTAAVDHAEESHLLASHVGGVVEWALELLPTDQRVEAANRLRRPPPAWTRPRPGVSGGVRIRRPALRPIEVSGLRWVEAELRSAVARAADVRVLTTTYMGATSRTTWSPPRSLPGPATSVSHRGSNPIAAIRRLATPAPTDWLAEAGVLAG